MAVLITQGLLLSESYTYPLTHSRIGYHTYTRDLDKSNVTASSEEDDFPEDAPLRPDTYERWKPTSMNATWQLDLGALKAVSYIGIAAHSLGTDAVTVTAEYSTDGGSTWSTWAELAPGNDDAIMLLADEQEARYWRLSLSGTTAPSIGVVYIGQILEMMRPIYAGHSPITLSRNTILKRSMSRGGQFLGQQIRRKGYETGVKFKNLKPAWYRDEFDPFVQDARKYPYFFAWRPADYPREVAYVWTGDDISPQNSGTRGWLDVSWNMVGFDD